MIKARRHVHQRAERRAPAWLHVDPDGAYSPLSRQRIQRLRGLENAVRARFYLGRNLPDQKIDEDSDPSDATAMRFCLAQRPRTLRAPCGHVACGMLTRQE